MVLVWLVQCGLKIVAEPTNAKYGQHLTMKQVHALTKPTEETYQIINTWFDETGAAITNIESLQGGSVLRLTMSAKDIKVLFLSLLFSQKLYSSQAFKSNLLDKKIFLHLAERRD